MPRNLSVLSLHSMDSDVLYTIQKKKKKCRIIESERWEGKGLEKSGALSHLFVNTFYSIPQNRPSSHRFKKKQFFKEMNLILKPRECSADSLHQNHQDVVKGPLALS